MKWQKATDCGRNLPCLSTRSSLEKPKTLLRIPTAGLSAEVDSRYGIRYGEARKLVVRLPLESTPFAMKRFPPFVWMIVVLLVAVLIAVLVVGSTPEQGEVSAATTPVNSPTSREKTPSAAPAPSAVALPAVEVTDSKDKPASDVAGAEIVIPPPPPTPEPTRSPAQSSQAPPNQPSSSSDKGDSDKADDSTQEKSSSKKQEEKAEPTPTPKPQKPQKSKWDQCIDRVDPGRSVDWRKGDYGHYGQASTNYVLLGNHTPDHRKCAVVYHEWFHTVHARKEGGIDNILNTYGRNRVESIADCGALLLGADWVGYGCGGDTDRQKAREILGW